MINCPNCGALNSEGSQVCGACGTALINVQNNAYNVNNLQEVNNVNNQNAFDNVNTLNNQYQQYNEMQDVQQGAYLNNAQSNDSIDDDVLINAYIGKNADTLRNGSFSWCTLFLEGVYIWYRKMYGLLAIWFLIMLGLGVGENVVKYVVLANSSTLVAAASTLKIFNTMFKIIELIVVLVIAFNFKELYLKHVKEKVLVIKSENPNSTEDELVQICKKRGGTTFVPILVFVILGIGGFILIFLTSFKTTTKYLDNSKKEAMAETGLRAVEAVRNEVIVYGMTGESKIYNINDLNNLLETKLDKSSYGKKYKDAKVQVIKTMNGFLYKVCLIDSGHNGFGYVESNSLNSDSVLVGKAPSSCQ